MPSRKFHAPWYCRSRSERSLIMLNKRRDTERDSFVMVGINFVPIVRTYMSTVLYDCTTQYKHTGYCTCVRYGYSVRTPFNSDLCTICAHPEEVEVDVTAYKKPCSTAGAQCRIDMSNNKWIDILRPHCQAGH